jgi:metal-sulfur cluster biosynthetic enzyme
MSVFTGVEVSSAGGAPAADTTLGCVWKALGTVQDPEIGEDVAALGFVDSATVSDDGVASVRLRLPTFFCAPNFAFLMVADAQDAVSAVPGVSRVDVALIDHFAADAINEGVAARAGFMDSFGDEANDELDELRRKFVSKAVLAGTDQVVRPLMTAGATPEELAEMSIADAPPSAELDRLRRRRAELGLSAGDGDPLVIDPSGKKVGVEALPLHMRKARLTRTNMDANSGVCRGQLAFRYGTADAPPGD